ncbi:hypothetical protein [Anaerobutyricum soehngenii]|uniref:hypothetical protein n=1 Tax=Anaerobutyricum soehngenii TaxID=105843 RepID=UPI0032BF8EB7
MEIFLSDLLKEEGRESRVNFYNAFKERKEIEVVRAEDVVKGIDYCLVREHYKLRTSQKKWLIKEIEKIDARSFGLALAQSHTVADRSKTILNFLSYNKFSRSPEHRVIVKDLRNGSLMTANKFLKQKVRRRDLAEVKRVVGAVPSLFWERLSEMIDHLSQEELREVGESCHFSLGVLVTALAKENTPEVRKLLEDLVNRTLAKMNLGIKGKRVRVAMENYSPEFSLLGEVMANKILDDTRLVRVKLQWKDTVCNSIDLITTKEENEHLAILGHGEEREELLSSKDNCGVRCAEWIDLDLAKVNGKFNFHAHLYSGRNLFSQVSECTLTVEKINKLGGESVRELENWRVGNDSGFVDLGTLDSEARIFAWRDKSTKYSISKILTKQNELNYSLQDLINDVVKQQSLEVVESGEDFVLKL